ncbi:hypothetical protein FACS18949_15890 [Clostridia bacterium]|nr:hypothetical protein FACS189425_02910 [Clostridia bacterium]GHV36458.1 hypothetical protein FACS18949_15890 [Clostridia bacterium]
MILYLTCEQNENQFDNSDGIVKHVGQFDLSAFLLRDAKNFEPFTHLVIDHQCLTNDEREIVDTIKSFMLMYDAKIIYFRKAAPLADKLTADLIDAGVFDIITSAERSDVERELAECLAGRTEAQARGVKAEKPVLTIRKTYKTGVCVGVFGAESKAGCTATALGLAAYLAKQGCSVCLAEVTGQRRLPYLPSINGVKPDYDIDESADFNIVDFGAVTAKKAAIAASDCDMTVVCSHTKPYELAALENALALLTNADIQLVFSFAEDERDVLERFGNALFAKYAPRLGDADTNAVLFERLLAPFET